MNALIRENGGHVLEVDSLLHVHGTLPVDRIHVKQRREFFLFRLDAPHPCHDVPGTEVEPPDLGRRNIDIVVAGEIVFGTEEAKAVGHDFQDAGSDRIPVRRALQLLREMGQRVSRVRLRRSRLWRRGCLCRSHLRRRSCLPHLLLGPALFPAALHPSALSGISGSHCAG